MGLDKIDNKVTNLFDLPPFQAWVKFVMMRYEPPTDPYEVMFVTLSSHFDNEKALVDAMIGAKDNTISKELLVYQYNKWKNNEQTPENVYVYLGLKETTGNLIDNPFSFAWLEYVRFLSSNDDTAATAMLKVVGNKHRDELNELFEKTKEQASKKRKEQASNLEGPPPPKLLRKFD